MHTRIVESCRKICACINSSRKQKLFVKRLSLLFKVDQDYRLALILCTNLKVEDLREEKSVKAFTRHVDSVIWENKFCAVESTERLADRKSFNAKIEAVLSSSKLRPSHFKHCALCYRLVSTRTSQHGLKKVTQDEKKVNRTIDVSCKSMPRR